MVRPDRAPHADPGRGAATPSGTACAVLGEAEITRALRRMAHEILETTADPDLLVILGILRGGAPLAARLAHVLGDLAGRPVPAGVLDAGAHRDDLAGRPAPAASATRLSDATVDGRVVVLVDDVLHTGRTVRAALDALRELGRPRAVRLAVLVDRGERELPIRADHVGKNLRTAPSDRVEVRTHELDGVDAVLITAGAPVPAPPNRREPA